MEWIDVKDRLPDLANESLGYSDEVLAFSDVFGKFFITRYDHYDEFWAYEKGHDQQYNPITHWMPLPEPPNQ